MLRANLEVLVVYPWGRPGRKWRPSDLISMKLLVANHEKTKWKTGDNTGENDNFWKSVVPSCQSQEGILGKLWNLQPSFLPFIGLKLERDNQLWNWNLVGAKVLRVKHTFVMFSVSRVSYLRGPRSKLLQNNYFHLKNTLKVYEKSPPSPSIRGASIFVNGWIEQTTPTNTLSLSLLEHQ